MNKIKKISFIVAGIATLTAMNAAMAVAPLPTGWYLEGNVGNSKVSNVSYAAGSSLTSSGVGLNLNVGYKFIPFFGMEAGYTKYANTSSKVGNVKVASASYYSYDIAAKPLLPIGDTGAELFAKLGIAHLHSKVTADSTVPGVAVSTGKNNVNGYYFGLGADYYFLPMAAINGQWQRAKGNSQTGTLDLYSLGLSYLFG